MGAALAAGAVTVPSLLTACGGGSSGGSSSGGTGGKTVTFGSNHSDPLDKKAMEATLQAYQTKSGKTVKVNTVDHNTFQENINRYLQGNPDDVFTLVRRLPDAVLRRQGARRRHLRRLEGLRRLHADALKAASTGDDGKQYFVPFYYYPWAVFYRKSLWQEKGYQAPKTWTSSRRSRRR